MINLIKMNVYRLFRTKLFYILLIVSLLLSALIYTIESDLEEQQLDQTVIEQENLDIIEDGEAQFGMTVSSNINDNSLPIEDRYSELATSGLLLIIVGIFAVIFADEERKHGFIKNLTLGKRDRIFIFEAKFVPILIFSFTLNIMILLGCYWGTNVNVYCTVANPGALALFIVRESLLATCFGHFMMALYEACRKPYLMLVSSIFIAMGILQLFNGKLQDVLVSKGIVSMGLMEYIGLNQYMLTYRAASETISGTLYPHLNNWIVIAVAFVIWSALGMFASYKKDQI